MKKSKDDDRFFMVSGFTAAALVIIAHYFFISNLNFHSTIHVIISIFLFFLLAGVIGSLLEKIWNK
ncbi:MAG: hypothetical protein KKH88_03550 [Nanoarchaeota archaeon]|nr:hypothetical protein [Nanoarchaeota archaeon]MBU1444819.1 hypothetical protein [Nanoarchaeota archaeon]MBU2419987.1 hypothetical protein [Nanoarchaeota archaeon]MBU2475446.1 hypothetical protein [Nanoarchaeota archaeon]MBU3940973.1 hypothetical protein [Nanoarchaeota archaeon]